MDYKKRRSSLRKALADVGQSDTRNIKRRSISFSGKNSVRVFHGEEEPKTWNNSYEILDHANNKSTMSSTRDLINVSYQHENSKIYQIGHSVDITLHEREITFQGAQVQRINQSITDLFSIPLEDHEKEVRTTLPGEETIDYMSHLKNTSNLIDNDVNNQKDNDPLHELAYKDQYHDSTCNRSANSKTTVFINDSLSISCIESISDSNSNVDNKENTFQANEMQFSPQKSRQYDKENRSPFSDKKENLFQASAIQLSGNDAQQCNKENESTSAIQNANETKYNDVNVKEESFVFSNKINQMIFLPERNDNMPIFNIVEPKDIRKTVKSPTASLNHLNSFETKTKNPPTTYFDQEIEASPLLIRNINSEKNMFTQSVRSRPNSKFSKTLEFSPKKPFGLEKNNVHLDNIESRLSFNQCKERDLPTFPTYLNTKMENLDKDIHVSYLELSQKPTCSKGLNSNRIRTHGIPLLKNTEISMGLLAPSKKEEEHNLSLKIDLDEPTIAEETRTKLSLNFSLRSAKNMSLSPESSSPLSPFEFKGYCLKQLNDEIESGKIKVFFNAANTPTTDRRIRITTSSLPIFEEKNIPLLSDKSNESLFINTTKENVTKETKADSKCRYSHANEIMLENSSFLTRVNLDDETKNNDFVNTSDGSSMEAAIKLEAMVNPSLKSKKICNAKNVTLTSGFRNHILEPPQTIRYKKDSKSFTSLYDTMDISYKIEKELGKDVNDSQQSFILQTEEFEKRSRQTMFFKNDDVVVDNVLNEADFPEYANNRLTLLYLEKCNQMKNVLKFETDSIKIDTYSDHKIPLANELMTMDQQNIQNNKTEECAINACQSKNKMYFHHEISLEKLSVRAGENLFFDSKIPLDTESITISEIPPTAINVQENTGAEETGKENCNLSLLRKTFDCKKKIPLENVSIESKENNQADKTLYLNNETVIEHKNSQAVKSGKVRKTLFFNASDTENENNKNKENLMELTFDDLDINKIEIIKSDAHTTKKTSSRKSIYTPELMNLTLSKKEPNKILFKELQTVNSTTDNEQFINNVDAAKYKKCGQISVRRNSVEGGLKALVYEYSNEMPNDHTFRPAKPLTNLIDTCSVADTSKLINKQHQPLMTPMKSAGDVINLGLVYTTPRLSLLEFTALEKKTSEEEWVQSAKYLSPFRTERANKRFSANLTPAVRMPIKRQTLIFEEFLLDETPISNSIDNSLKKMTNPEENASNLEQNITKKQPECLNKSDISDNETDIGGIIPNDSFLKTPPKKNNSCIQISISKGYNIVSPRDRSSNNHKEDFKLDIECDVLAESIQIVRRATTSTKKKLTYTAQHSLDAAKHLIYDDNPITISDVSEFFETQRQSVIPQTEMSLNLDKTDKSMPLFIDNPKKSFQNRYISLTLEDIEKARLSLVEDGSDFEQEDNAIEKLFPSCNRVTRRNVENINMKGRCDNVNYLRDISHVCRKCDRCQKSILNEISSSSSESVALPRLSPLPELGLDRLKRLRSRPTIADVNVLWQRVSLDRTIIDVQNRFEHSCQTLAVLDDTKDPVTKCIRKYENDMLRFETQFLEEQRKKETAKKLPFVLRLNDFLSANQNNWIFDYQMQSRGKLLFTHKKILTLTLLFTFDEVDPLGYDISLKSISLEKSNVPIKNWKPIDFVLDFQLKLNLPFNLQLLCKGNNEASIFKILQEINGVCLDTVKAGNCLQRISFTNGASIIRDGCRTYVRKIIRKIVQDPGSNFKYVKKTEIKVELLNLKKLSFKDIVSPPLHQFHEDIHLLPTGLQFLQEFLKSPLNYLDSL